MSKKIDFDNIFLNPIDNFYKKINENLKDDINNLILNKINNSNISFDKQEKLQIEINQNEESIKNFYIQNDIKKRNILNAVYIVSFVFIFGLFFMKKYLDNKKIRTAYKKLKKELLKNNEINNKQISKYNRMSFSPINTFDFLKEIFLTKGFFKFELFSDYNFANYVLDYWNNNDQQGLCVETKGIQFLIRNNPVYDLILRVLDMVDVKTSNCLSFSYYDTEYYYDSKGVKSSRTVLKYENLCAYHIEKTPFILEKNLIFFKTNFSKNLIFTPNNQLKKSTKFENNEFNEIYRISKSENKIDLNIFFTLNAQENFVQWYKIQNSFLYFKKIYNSFVIFPKINKKEQPQKSNFLNDLCLNLNCFFSIPNTLRSFDEMKDFIANKFLGYFKKISNSITIPLLSPSISRECYIEDKNYLLINNYQEYLKNENLLSLNCDSNNFLMVINKLNRPIYFYFLNHKADKPCWFDLIDYKILNKENNLTKYSFNLKSYEKEILIDIVSVYGVHVGIKKIPVEYEKFLSITEIKTCYFIPFKKNNNFFNDKILINKLLDLNDFYYIDSKDSNFLKSNYIWFNNFSSSQKLEEDMIKIKKFSSVFQKLILTNNLNANMFIDHSGLYLNINDNVDDKIENYVINLLNEIN